MNERIKITLCALFTVFLYCIAPAIVFSLLRLPLWLALTLIAIGLVYALVCLTANCVAQKRATNAFIETPLSVWQTHFEKRREEIRANVAEEAKKINDLLVRALCYNLSLALAFLCISCGIVSCMRETVTLDEEFPLSALIMIAVLVCIYLYVFYMPVVTALYRKATRDAVHDKRLPLAEGEYPLLYALAAKSARATGFKGRYRLMLNDENGVSVAEENGICHLYLSPVLAPLLTEEELYAVLVHEFAHVTHDDTGLTEKYKNACFRYGERTGFQKIAGCFFSRIGGIVERETDLFFTYASLLREQNADGEVLKHADPQAYMNATAKAYLLDEVFREPVKQFAYGVYAGEAPPDDFYKQKAEYYKEHAKEHYPHALKIMLRRLPAHNDSHPTFAMRAKVFGIETFDPFRYPEGAFLAEAQKYTAACDRELCRFLTMQWKGMREENYVLANDVCERYERAPEAASEGRKLTALSVYFETDYQKALPLAERLLQEDQNCNAARYFKGVMSCIRDDEAGLPLLLQAMRDDFNLAEAFGLYGDCILRTGKQELLDELRRLQTSFGQELVDQLKRRYRERFSLKPSRLTACPHDDRYEAIRRSVEDIAQITLRDVYLCMARTADGVKTFYLLLPYPADERTGKLGVLLQRYFSLLWRKNEEYYVRYCKPNDKYIRRAQKLDAKIL